MKKKTLFLVLFLATLLVSIISVKPVGAQYHRPPKINRPPSVKIVDQARVLQDVEQETQFIILEKVQRLGRGEATVFKSSYNDGTHIHAERVDNLVYIDWADSQECPRGRCLWGGRALDNIKYHW